MDEPTDLGLSSLYMPENMFSHGAAHIISQQQPSPYNGQFKAFSSVAVVEREHYKNRCLQNAYMMAQNEPAHLDLSLKMA